MLQPSSFPLWFRADGVCGLQHKAACCKQGDSGLMAHSTLLFSSISGTCAGWSTIAAGKADPPAGSLGHIPHTCIHSFSSPRNILPAFRQVVLAVLQDVPHSRFHLKSRAVKHGREVAFPGFSGGWCCWCGAPTCPGPLCLPGPAGLMLELQLCWAL